MSPRARRFFGCVLPLSIVLVGCGVTLMVGYAGQVFLQAIEIEDDSMAPLVEPGETVIIDNTVFWADPPGRGLVVSVPRPDGEIAIRRLAAIPGDTVAIEAGRLVLDGVPCDGHSPRPNGRPCWHDGAGPAPEDFGPLTLGPDEYFVLAHRWDAEDSRRWGVLTRAEIFGVARFRTRDLTQVGAYDNVATTEPPLATPEPRP